MHQQATKSKFAALDKRVTDLVQEYSDIRSDIERNKMHMAELLNRARTLRGQAEILRKECRYLIGEPKRRPT